MSSGHPSRRVQRARSELSHRRTSMDSMKTEFRNRFLDRLRTTRSKSVDRLRRIVENYENDAEYHSLNELRHILLTEKDATDLISTDDVSDLLKEVEEELRQVSLEYEAEKYATESQKETEDVVDRLMGQCQVCQYLSVETVCPKCKVEISSEFM